MKKDTINSLLVLMFLLLAVGCKTKKATIKAPDVAEGTTVKSDKKRENLKMLKENDLPYTTLSLKGKASLEIDGKENGLTINVRMKKDKLIWISMTAIAGIEVARVLISPDSLIVRNNLQAVAVKKPFSFIYRYTSKQVSFSMLQAVISGNTIADIMNADPYLEFNSGVFMLSGTKGDLGYRALFNTLFKTEELNLNDVKAGQALKVVYSDYQDVTGALFPSVTSINSLSGTKKTNIKFDFSKIERNLPLDFPFSVPKRFELIN